METGTGGRSRRRRLLLQVGIFVIALAAPAVAQAAQKYAVVNSAGAVVRSVGATGSIHLSTGTYEVDFSSSMLNCAYVATVGDPGAGAVSQPAVATVATRAGNNRGLFIQTFDQTTGSAVDLPFQVQTFCGLKHWAVVASDGSLARGGHATSSTRLATGAYEVIFDGNVSKCAYTASLGTTSTGSVGDPGQVTVAGRAGNVNGVFVEIVNRSGTPVDSSFHLSVNCGSAKLIGVINANGTKARGPNVVSSTKLSGANGGTYEVIFNRNVSACSYTATVGTTTNGGSITTPVTITTATRAGNANGVFLFIHQTNGATIDEPFHLFVLCAPVASSAGPAAAGDGSQDAPSQNAAPVGAGGADGGANS